MRFANRRDVEIVILLRVEQIEAGAEASFRNSGLAILGAPPLTIALARYEVASRDGAAIADSGDLVCFIASNLGDRALVVKASS